MNELTGASEIRQLSDDYFNQRISWQQYREQRKLVLDCIDEEVNGISNTEVEEQAETSLLGKAFAFFKSDNT